MTPTPIACTLSPDQLRCGADQLLPGLAREARLIRRSADGVQLEFATAPGLLSRIAHVIEHERQCCQFLRFVVEVVPAEERIRLVIDGPEGTGTFLESLAPAFAAAAG